MESDENRNAERMRLLKMLEEGKINAGECGELLDALAEPPPPPPPPRSAAAPVKLRKAALCGLALVLIGFFMTWFTVDVNLAMAKALGAVAPGLQSNHAGIRLNGIPVGSDGGMSVRLSGGDVSHGLGWIVLACAIAAALIPRWKVGAGLMLLAVAILVYCVLGILEIGAPALGFWLALSGVLLEGLSLLSERVASPGA